MPSTTPQAQKPKAQPQAPPPAPPPAPKPWQRRISEDWWSVIIGMALIALVAAGVISSVPW